MGERALWEYSAGVSFGDLGTDTTEAACALVLDHLTCAIVGAQLPWVALVRRAFDVHGPWAGSGRSVLGPAHLYGSHDLVGTATAALVNGTAAHGLDFDDLYLPAMTHPGSVVIAAAMSVAEALQLGGKRLIEAVVAGYEVMGRIGRAVGTRNVDHGFHATGQQGPIGSTTAVGRLLDFDAAAMESAAGIAASLGGGIKAFTNGPGMVKRLHAGRAAEAGVLAAHARTEGVEGPRLPLTSRFGFVSVFALDGPGRPDELSAGLGVDHVVDRMYLKPFAACGALHGALEAGDRLSGRIADARDIERVLVGTTARVLAQNSDPDPRDVMAAQYSMEYALSLGLLGRARDAMAYLEVEHSQDRFVRHLARLISLERDEEAERSYPDAQHARVEVLLRDGTRLAETATVQAASSFGWDVAEGKFLASTGRVMSPAEQGAVLNAVRGLLDDAPAAACPESLSALRPRS